MFVSLFVEPQNRVTVESFYWIKNKEQGRERYKRAGCLGHIVKLVWDEKKEGKRAQSLLGIWDWLTGYTAFCLSRVFTGTGKLSKLWFSDVAPWGKRSLILGLESYFNIPKHNKIRLH